MRKRFLPWRWVRVNFCPASFSTGAPAGSTKAFRSTATARTLRWSRCGSNERRTSSTSGSSGMMVRVQCWSKRSCAHWPLLTLRVRNSSESLLHVDRPAHFGGNGDLVLDVLVDLAGFGDL